MTVDADFSKLSFQLEMDANPTRPSIHFLLAGTSELTVDAGVKASACVYEGKFKLVVPIPGTPLQLETKPALSISASGQVAARFTWKPRIAIGFDRAKDISQQFFVINPGEPDMAITADGGAELFLGAKAELTLGKRVGVGVEFGPVAMAETDTANNNCLNLSAALRANVSASADVFVKDWQFTVASGTFMKKRLKQLCPGGGVGTEPTHRSVILRVPATGASYLVDRDGRPHWIPSGGTYNCLTRKFAVRTVSQAVVDRLGDGKPWQPACNSVARVSATGTSFVIDGQGAPHWIPDGETYHCVIGARGLALTDGLSQAHIDTLGNGQPWQPRCLDPGRVAGKIARVSATGTSYFVDRAGQPHWIPDGSVYSCLTRRGIAVVDGLEQAHVDSIGNGQPWQPRCNSIMTVSASGTSYVLDGDGRPRWIPDAETYHCMTGRGLAVTGGLPQALVDTLGNGQPWQDRCLNPNRARNKVLTVAGGASYFYDGTLHWIPDVETYWCLRGRGIGVLDGLVQQHADSLGNGQPWQPRCMAPSRANGHILTVAGGPSYVYHDGALRWISGVETYWCWRNTGWTPIEGLTQQHADSLGNGQPWARECIDPARVRRHVVREKGGTAYFVDAGDWWHWIPDGGTYNCLVARYRLTNNVSWGEINSLRREGAHANCSM